MLPYARMTAGRAREACGVLAGAALLTVVLTWPLASAPGRYGRTDSGDGEWSLWVVSWVAHALTTAPATLYDANAFHPHRSALAFSEPNIGAGLVAAPVWVLTRNPFAAYNWVVFLSFVGSAAAAYGLGRHLTGSRAGAAFAGIAFAFSPFVFARFAHIQLLLVFGLPLSAWAMHRFVDAPDARRAAALGLALAAQGLCCGYYGVAAGLLVGAGLLWFGFARSHWRHLRYWALAALAAALAVAIVAPFLLPIVRLQQETGFERPFEDNARWAADWRAWLASAAWAHRWVLPWLGSWKEVLFPGVLPVALAGAGVTIGWRAAPQAPLATAGPMPPPRRDVLLFYVVIALLTFWATFGPALGLYTLLYRTVPLFSLLRAPGRFGIIVNLALAVLAAYGVALLLARTTGRTRTAVAWLLPALLAIELAQVPVRFRDNDPAVHPVYRMLAALPPAPVVEVPFFDRSVDYWRHARYMRLSTAHWRPLVNGYSDAVPPEFRERARVLAGFPDRPSFAALEPLGARYVVVHPRLFAPGTLEDVERRLALYSHELRLLSRQDAVWLYEITDWPR
jgi:hypothetical protein